MSPGERDNEKSIIVREDESWRKEVMDQWSERTKETEIKCRRDGKSESIDAVQSANNSACFCDH